MTTPNRRLWAPRTLAIGVLVLVLAVALGGYAGLRAPWGTKHPQVKQGTAVRANSENDLVMFDAEDGTQLTLHADNLWWETDSAEGDGDPPCLQEPGNKTPVEVGFLWVAGANGGARPVPLRVKCL